MKSYTIALEGSTYRGSVALLRHSRVVAERSLGGEDGGVQRSGKGEKLMPAIAECLKEARIERDEIARIVCGAGPGSFTSLRVAGSVAKGLAIGYGVDLFAVSSLLLIVTGAPSPLPAGDYLSVLDAMRGEFFVARVKANGDQTAVQVGSSMLMRADDLRELAEQERGSRVVGPGQQIDLYPHARGVAPLLETIVAGGKVDLASWEPDYGRLAEAQVRWEAENRRPLPR
ncbi:MAG: tRNA (adenosine(37)-N6)-threonylcarbamoyltransferase complex dimerization subunit type 1 TsaB [Gemmatimonadaceae bacterium]